MINYSLYFDYKVFELIRDRLTDTINQYRHSGDEHDFYKHIFIAPEELARRRSFKLKGVLSPYVCVWSPTNLIWDPKKYARSVLSRDFSYEEDNETKYTSGYLYDSQRKYNIVAASYYADFVGKVQEELHDFDRLRYFDIDCSELLPGFKTRIEFLLGPITNKMKINEEQGQREFIMSAQYDIKVTYPALNLQGAIDQVNVYLNDRKIYEFRGD